MILIYLQLNVFEDRLIRDHVLVNSCEYRYDEM